jgi:hypothetical protein
MNSEFRCRMVHTRPDSRTPSSRRVFPLKIFGDCSGKTIAYIHHYGFNGKVKPGIEWFVGLHRIEMHSLFGSWGMPV